jgi:hypothetical protein
MNELTDEDHKSVDRAGRILRERRWRKTFTLDEMMAAWEQLVAPVELGYGEVVDEYTNDLACRDWLAAAWPLVTDHVRRARKAELDALDSRFLAATEDSSGMLQAFYPTDSIKGWWWQRRPIRRLGDFAADLKSLEGA